MKRPNLASRNHFIFSSCVMVLAGAAAAANAVASSKIPASRAGRDFCVYMVDSRQSRTLGYRALQFSALAWEVAENGGQAPFPPATSGGVRALASAEKVPVPVFRNLLRPFQILLVQPQVLA